VIILYYDTFQKVVIITINEQIKLLRKTLDLTQQKFAERIGLKQNSIALIESGKRNISDQAILSICREFNVNSEWLRTGEGEMFIVLPEEDEYFAAATEISNDNDTFAMNAIIEYWKLDRASKDAIKNYIMALADKCKKDEQV
jgi:transcriptional regulator with XRE-family HTH domain